MPNETNHDEIRARCAAAEMMGSWTLSDANLYPDKVLMMVHDLNASCLALLDELAQLRRDAAGKGSGND